MEFLASLHPAFVHFPIVLFVLYFFAELFSVASKNEMIAKIAILFLGLGVMFSLLSALSGNQSFEMLKHVLKSKDVLYEKSILYHEQNATITLWYFFTLFVLRVYLLIKKSFSYHWKIVFCVLSLVGLYFVYQTGTSGGKLVYDLGIGTKLFLSK